MKIIQVIPNLAMGGAEIMCETLTYELTRKGHNVIVVSLYNYHSDITERMEKLGIDIRYLNKSSGMDLSVIRKMKKIFKIEKPDVIHTHRHVLQYAIPAAAASGVNKRVHTIHSIAAKENTKLLRRLNKVFFKKFGVIPVALSDMVKSTIIEEYKLPGDKVPVVYNGIDLTKCIVKDSYDINEKFKIIHVGRFQEVKNHVGLVEAFKLFHDKYPESELQLIGDGPLKEQIQNYVSELGLDDCVSFLGLQTNVYGFLNKADIFTLPSLYEGIPMTLIEAMGTAMPIVASDVGGISDMLDNNSALLVSVNSSEFSRAFEKYYIDGNMRKNHGEAAHVLSEKFSSSCMAEGYLKIYS